MDEQCKTCNINEGCSQQGNPNENCLERFILMDKINQIKRKILVMSGKGGVGKSSVAVNLAYTLSLMRKKVGLLDVDIHGPNIPKMLGIEDKNVPVNGTELTPIFIPPTLKVMSIGLLLESPESAVIWRGPLKMKMIEQFFKDVSWGELDYLIIDAPPGTGDEPLSVAQLVTDAEAIIVTTPQDVSILDVKKSITFCKQINMKIAGIVENMSTLLCPHCNKEISLFKSGGGEKLASQMGIKFLGKIPLDPSMVECGDEGEIYIKKYSSSPISEIFKKIVTEGLEKKEE